MSCGSAAPAQPPIRRYKSTPFAANAESVLTTCQVGGSAGIAPAGGAMKPAAKPPAQASARALRALESLGGRMTRFGTLGSFYRLDLDRLDRMQQWPCQ